MKDVGRLGSSDHFAMLMEVEVKGSIENRILAPIGKKKLREEAE